MSFPWFSTRSLSRAYWAMGSKPLPLLAMSSFLSVKIPALFITDAMLWLFTCRDQWSRTAVCERSKSALTYRAHFLQAGSALHCSLLDAMAGPAVSSCDARMAASVSEKRTIW